MNQKQAKALMEFRAYQSRNNEFKPWPLELLRGFLMSEDRCPHCGEQYRHREDCHYRELVRISELEAEVAKLREALREYQFTVISGDDHREFCIGCGQWKTKGCAKDCDLAALLGGGE